MSESGDPHEEKVDVLSHCLVPLLDALGWRGSSVQIEEALPRTSQTMNLGSLLNTMANMHYEGRVSQLTPAELESQLLPLLCIDDRGNAQVLMKRTASGQHLVYNGQARKYQEVEPARERMTVIRFIPMKRESSNLLSRQPYWFLNLSLRFLRLYFVGVVVSVLLSLIALASPFFIMSIYGQLQVAGAQPPLFLVGCGILIYILADLAFRMLRSRIFMHLSDRTAYLLSTQVLRRILMMPAGMTEGATTQSQLSRVRDFESISSFFSGPAIHGLLDLLTTFVLLAGMMYIGGNLVWIPICALALAFVFACTMRSVITKSTALANRSEGRKQEVLHDMITQFRAVKTSGVARPMVGHFHEMNAEASLSSLETSRVHTTISTFFQGLNQFAGLATMIFGVYLVMDGKLASGGLLACMLLTWKILGPIRNLFSVIS